jgi:DNA-binding MarR family transcriptional regulator
MAKTEPGGRGGSIEDLCELLMDTLHEVQCHGASDSLAIMNATGLTLPQIITLYLLQAKSPCTLKEISQRIRLSPAATSHLVSRLYKKKLVCRTEDQHDRRCKQISLSHLGVTVLSRLIRARRDGFTKALGFLSGGTRSDFAGVLARVREEFQSEPAGSPDGTGAPGSRAR